MIFREAINTKYNGYTRGQIAAINYFEYLASTNGVDISEEDVEKFLDSIKSQQKRDINAFFFKKYSDEKEKPEVSKKEVKEITESYAEFAEKKRKEQVDLLKQRLTNAKGMITKRQNEVQNYLKEYHESKQKLDILEDRKADWFKIEIEKILKDKFWKFHGRGDKFIEFTTRSNVVLTDPAAGFTINFGKYRARLHLNTFHCTIHKHENNLCMDEDLIHPYCHADDSMCYGGKGGEQANKFSQDGALFNLMSLVKNTLTYYNPESNPYANLNDFKRHMEGFDTRDDQATEEDDENHFTCENCGDRYHTDEYARDGWCQTCFDDEHFYCDSCDEYYHNDYFGGDHFQSGNIECKSCYEESQKEKKELEEQKKQEEMAF